MTGRLRRDARVLSLSKGNLLRRSSLRSSASGFHEITRSLVL
jgi:hypothetical protein